MDDKEKQEKDKVFFIAYYCPGCKKYIHENNGFYCSKNTLYCSEKCVTICNDKFTHINQILVNENDYCQNCFSRFNNNTICLMQDLGIFYCTQCDLSHNYTMRMLKNSVIEHLTENYLYKYELEKLRMNDKDPVNHPSHYTSHPNGIEAIEITKHEDFLTGNALKYILRHKLKGKPLEDLEKAIWYLKRRIEILKANGDKENGV